LDSDSIEDKLLVDIESMVGLGGLVGEKQEAEVDREVDAET